MLLPAGNEHYPFSPPAPLPNPRLPTGKSTGTTQTISRPNKLHISTDASPAAIQVIDAPHSHPGLTSTPTNAPRKQYHDIVFFGQIHCLLLDGGSKTGRYCSLSTASRPTHSYTTFRSTSSSDPTKTATVDFAIIFHDGDRPELYSSQVRRFQPPNLPTPSAGPYPTVSSSIRADKLNSTNTSSGQQRSDASSRCTK